MGITTRGSSKLMDWRRKELILDLCESFSLLHTPKEVGEVLTDLLTPKEIETVAKRLQIAAYLVEGKDYETIRNELKVGFSTIARVNTWLNLSGEGFKIILSRKKKTSSKLKRRVNIEERYDPYSWHNIKRRNTIYFWPQLLLEELMKASNKEEKEKIYTIFDKMEIKRLEFKRENNKQLYDMFSPKKPGK